ncbi:MAG: hypothetical protein QM778_22765 [Myxococcales bacterium]
MAMLLSSAQHASALEDNICIQTNWASHGNSQNLTCTANDVRVAEAFNICVPDATQPSGQCCQSDGCQPTCIQGTQFTFTADFRVDLTAQTRYDVGIYFATDGGGSDGALTGACELNTIDPANGQNFTNQDRPPDVCGDIVNTSAFNPQIVHLEVGATCQGTAANPEQVNLPNCTSWRQSGANEVCDEARDAFPGSPSKCNCQPNFAIDIFVEPPDAAVVKTAKSACVTFEVKVSNPTQTKTLSLNSLIDAPYGDITNAANPNLCSTTCGGLPRTLAPGADYTCTFAARVASLATVQTDTVTATLTSDGQNIQRSGSERVLIDLDPPSN